MTAPSAPRRILSLKLRLGIGAALLGLGTLLTALILYLGLNEVARRLDTALASETRMARYATLSQQTATFLVVATEMTQRGLPPETRADRIAPVTAQIYGTLERLQADVGTAVQQAEALGLDEQSRYGTQSLGLARMEAMLRNTEEGLANPAETDPGVLRAHIDGFVSAFDPLLSQAVSTEVLFRNTILAGIEALRDRLALAALAIALMTILMVAAFYLILIRPQFRRLDRLREAAQRIGRSEFDVALPVTTLDEIGQLSFETNRMAAALAARQQAVQVEWDRLNETIANRTEELRAANATLEEIDENRRRFFADISHELRTPLTVILMEAQIGKQAEPSAADAFGIIETRASRLNRKIDDLLRIARSDTGQLALDPQSIALPGLVQDVIGEVEAELDSSGIELILGDMPEASVIADRNWLRQVVVSLLRNAIRHARAGALVELSGSLDADQAGICVTDNGPGIAGDEQSKVFERFAQGSGAANAQGFGVGLALAKWVIEAQEGEISLISPVPRNAALGSAPGTKIVVRLPLSKG